MKLAVLLWIVFYTTAALAGKPETVIAVPADTPKAGEEIVFSAYLHNAGNDPLELNIPEDIICQLASAEQTVEVTARSVEPKGRAPIQIPAGGFVKVRYALSVPASLLGPVQMEVPALDHARVMFAVRAPSVWEQEKKRAAPDKPEPPKYSSLDSLFALYQPYLKNISAYEPMYFLVGTEPEKSKFQVSFKYRFLNPEGSLAQNYPWTQGFHFAYTQTSFWDLQSASMPFDDTSYKPELFFLSSSIDVGAVGIKRLFVQTGFQHESNGRDGLDSRSTNYLYVKPMFIFYDEKRQLGLQVAPKVWAYVAKEEDTNPDLEDYRGYFDLEMKFGKADAFVLGSNFRWAKEGGSIQLDLTYPLNRFLFKNLDLYLQAQYVNSLAESLLDYTERNEAFRLGLAIVR